MSHYFYNNVFDYVSADGNFGYFIEKDYLNSSSNSAVPSESNGGPDYIVEVHYLGGTAGTLKINVNDIDATTVEHVDWAPKGIGAPYVASPEGTFYLDSVDDTAGLSSWSAQQSALDPWMGIVEVKPPLDAPVTDWEGNTRNDGYLYMESTMFYDVVQKDNNLVFAMNNLLDGSSSLHDFLVALNSNLNTNAGALNPEEL